MNKAYIIISLVLIVISCQRLKPVEPIEEKEKSTFDTSLFVIKSNEINKMLGQVIYVPIYSNIPFKEMKPSHLKNINLSAILVIHNTDFNHNIKISNVLFFNNDGKLVKNFLTEPLLIRPLAAHNFYIPIKDTSGTGANFIVEWIATAHVTEPIVESVMLDMMSVQGISFTSKGKVLRELK